MRPTGMTGAGGDVGRDAACDGDDRWTLRPGDRALLGNKSGATRLGFAVLLKVFQADGRFPRRREDVPVPAVDAVAAQLGVSAAAWRDYDWRGRAIEYHRAQIRAALGFREATADDAAALARWLDGEVLTVERRHDRLLTVARAHCRARQVEPPAPERLDRLVRSVVRRHEGGTRRRSVRPWSPASRLRRSSASTPCSGLPRRRRPMRGPPIRTRPWTTPTARTTACRPISRRC